MHTSYLSQAPQAVPVEKNSAMWRNYRLTAEIVPFKCGENLSHGEISPHEKCGDKSVSIMCTIFDVLFCRGLRALTWRKIEPKIVTVEKKGQI